MTTLEALTTMTWSPVSRWGAKIGLCLPRRMRATSVARRPRTSPSASTRCQARWTSFGLGEYVRKEGVLLLSGLSLGAGTGVLNGATNRRKAEMNVRPREGSRQTAPRPDSGGPAGAGHEDAALGMRGCAPPRWKETPCCT